MSYGHEDTEWRVAVAELTEMDRATTRSKDT